MIYKEFIPWTGEAVLDFEEFECTLSFDDKLYSGTSLLGEESPKFYLRDPSGRAPDFLGGIGTVVPVVSAKVKEFLAGTEDAKYFEFLRADVRGCDGELEYYVLNLLQVLDAFDWERSEYDLFPDPGPKGNKVIEDLRKTVLKEDAVAGRNFFYVKEFSSKMFISSALEAALTSAGIGDFETRDI